MWSAIVQDQMHSVERGLIGTSPQLANDDDINIDEVG